MSYSDLVQKIVIFEIDIEEEDNNGPLVHRTLPVEEPEPTENATEEQLTEQEADTEQEEEKEEEAEVTIKEEKLDEPEDREMVETDGSDGSLACRRLMHPQQRRDNGAAPSTREKTEEKKDGEDTPKRKADNQTGEGRSGDGGSGQGPSGEGTSGESTSGDGANGGKKSKTEEPSNSNGDGSNSNTTCKTASDCFVTFN